MTYIIISKLEEAINEECLILFHNCERLRLVSYEALM